MYIIKITFVLRRRDTLAIIDDYVNVSYMSCRAIFFRIDFLFWRVDFK